MSKFNKCKKCGRKELPEGVSWVSAAHSLCSECNELITAEIEQRKKEHRAAWSKAFRPASLALGKILDNSSPGNEEGQC